MLRKSSKVKFFRQSELRELTNPKKGVQLYKSQMCPSAYKSMLSLQESLQEPWQIFRGIFIPVLLSKLTLENSGRLLLELP